MAANQQMANHGNWITSEVRRILDEIGTPEDQFVHWWIFPKEYIAASTKQLWCVCGAFTNILFPICIPCICWAVKDGKAMAQSQVFILTQSKIIAHHQAKLCCGTMGRDTKEHDLSTILSIQVANSGSGCFKTPGSVVQFTLPEIHGIGDSVGQDTLDLPCENPNEAMKIIREQKDIASQRMLTNVPQQRDMGAGENDAMERMKKLKDLLDAGFITHSEFETKKANLLAEL
eukprot:GEMP01059232.1.p1 GENE.GEMP01059232.1~~GEMP01059232.1.p1  ORF type:complete len:231 (+),score=35.05 GEMP01059232.1:221-913(+)